MQLTHCLCPPKAASDCASAQPDLPCPGTVVHAVDLTPGGGERIASAEYVTTLTGNWLGSVAQVGPHRACRPESDSRSSLPTTRCCRAGARRGCCTAGLVGAARPDPASGAGLVPACPAGLLATIAPRTGGLTSVPPANAARMRSSEGTLAGRWPSSTRRADPASMSGRRPIRLWGAGPLPRSATCSRWRHSTPVPAAAPVPGSRSLF